MTIKLYQTLTEAESVDKILSDELTLTGSLRAGTSILNPDILIEVSSLQTPSSYNYAYIEEFGRYYFIGDVKLETTKLWRFPMHVDVLMSWKTSIRNLYCVVSRTEDKTKANLYLHDPEYVTEQRKIITTTEFPNSLTHARKFVLTVLGSVGGSQPTE